MPYDYKAKAKNISNQNTYMLAKTISMFEWIDLPETIPYTELEKLLQKNGFAFITKVNGELYALNGGLGGLQDAYGNATQITISNVGLNFNATLDIIKDGVLILNDDFKMGLFPLFERYNTFLVENDITMMMYGYNSRTQKLISASDDKTKASAELAVKKAIDGDIAVIGESVIFEGIKVHSGVSNQGTSITSLTEFHQYIKASMYNEIGLSANFNMKRERLTAGEIEVGDDSNYPFVYNMLKCRLKAVEKINEMFGTEIDIQFGSVWSKSSKEVVDDELNSSVKTDINPDQNTLENTPSNGGSGGDDLEKTGTHQNAKIENEHESEQGIQQGNEENNNGNEDSGNGAGENGSNESAGDEATGAGLSSELEQENSPDNDPDSGNADNNEPTEKRQDTNGGLEVNPDPKPETDTEKEGE